MVLSLFNSISGPFGVILVHHWSFSAIFNYFLTLLTSANSDQFRTFLMLHSVSKKIFSPKEKIPSVPFRTPKINIFTPHNFFSCISSFANANASILLLSRPNLQFESDWGIAPMCNFPKKYRVLRSRTIQTYLSLHLQGLGMKSTTCNSGRAQGPVHMNPKRQVMK